MLNGMIWNPITGEWERIDDRNRPLPVIARDTQLVAVNNDSPFVPSLGSGSSNHTDIFGSTAWAQANIGIAAQNAQPNIIIPDAWRIRRFIVLFHRTDSGTTSVAISMAVYGRLIDSGGNPTTWRTIGGVDDSSYTGAVTARLVVPTSLSGVFGFDQYRITFRRNPDSTPAPQLSNIRVYAEF